MAWTDSCQKNRWHTRSLQEWEEWIDGLAEKGVGGYDKKSWIEWADSMLEKHGTLHFWLEPAQQGRPAKEKRRSSQEPPAEVPPALEDFELEDFETRLQPPAAASAIR